VGLPRGILFPHGQEGHPGAAQNHGDAPAPSLAGNVRELRNVIEHSTIITTGDTLRVPILEQAPPEALRVQTLADSERDQITKALEKTGWRIKGAKGAAAALGINPSTLYHRMSKLGIPTHRQKDDGLS